MNPYALAANDLSAAGWCRIAKLITHSAPSDLPMALQRSWLFIILFPVDDLSGRILCELGRRALERLALVEGVDVAGGRVGVDVARPMPRELLS